MVLEPGKGHERVFQLFGGRGAPKEGARKTKTIREKRQGTRRMSRKMRETKAGDSQNVA